MNKFKLFLIGLFLISSFCFSQEEAENDLMFFLNLESSDGIINYQKRSINISDFDNVEYTFSGSHLIKNKNANDLGKFHFNESEFVKISDIEVVIKDTSGNLIKELDNDEIKYNSVSQGFIFYDESRSVYFELLHNVFPYIVEFKIEIDFNSNFFLPSWYPQKDYPVKYSSLEIVSPEDQKIKWHNVHCNIEPIERKYNGKTKYFWEVENLNSYSTEDFLSPEIKNGFHVLISPEQFELSDSKGSCETWNSISKWGVSLYNNKMKLSEKTSAEIKTLVNGSDSISEKIEKLYKFLQAKTRYVAIITDIGGWEPHQAEDIFVNGYGDCKDLSVLMIAMLKELNIEAYPALVRTKSKGKVVPEFPSNQFNHVIAFVPLENDSLWIECTSDFKTFDDITSSVEGTYALIVKDDGDLVKISSSSADQNRWKSFTDCRFEKQKLKVNTTIKLTGNQEDYYFSLLKQKNDDEKILLIKRMMSGSFGDFNLEKYSYNKSDKSDTLFINISGSYKTKKKKRIFMKPGIFNVRTTSSLIEEIKEFPFDFSYSYADEDVIRIKIPQNYKLEKLPKTFSFNSEFAEYNSTVKEKDGYITYKRNYKLKQNSFSEEHQDEYNRLMKTMIKGDKSKIVIKRKALN